MPYCPKCHSEYRREFARCKDCETDLVETLEPEMELTDESIRKALEGKELTPVMTGNLDTVREFHQMLASKRIASIIDDDLKASQQHGHAPRVRLLIKSEDLEEVSAVLGANFKQMLETEGVTSNQDLSYDHCPACNAPISENITECPDCGLVIDNI